jgi:hypothetical protein
VSADRDRAHELVEGWATTRAPGTHLSSFGLRELEGRIARELEAVRRETAAAGTDRTGARVVEAWRDRPKRLPIPEAAFGDLEWLIDEAVLSARLEGVMRTMRLVARAVELAPWGVGDPLKIRDELREALKPDAEVPL